MSSLRNFELKAIALLAGDVLDQGQMSALEAYIGPLKFEYTGSGYFLTISQDWLPNISATLSKPIVVGTADQIQCGFLVFLTPRELLFECHSWGEVEVPPNFRDKSVAISTPPIEGLNSNEAET